MYPKFGRRPENHLQQNSLYLIKRQCINNNLMYWVIRFMLCLYFMDNKFGYFHCPRIFIFIISNTNEFVLHRHMMKIRHINRIRLAWLEEFQVTKFELKFLSIHSEFFWLKNCTLNTKWQIQKFYRLIWFWIIILFN